MRYQTWQIVVNTIRLWPLVLRTYQWPIIGVAVVTTCVQNLKLEKTGNIEFDRTNYLS